MKYEAIGFDLDGTLVNTNVNYDALDLVNENTVRSLGYPVEKKKKNENRTSRQPLYDWLIKNNKADEIERIDSILNEKSLEIEKEGASISNIYLNIVSTLSQLKKKGYKLGVVTKAGRMVAVDVLTHYKLIQFFDVIIARDDYPYEDAKPSPKAMIHLSESLNVPVSKILYVGDGSGDYLSAKNAGVDFFGVLTGRGTRKGWSELDENIPIIRSVADIESLL